LKELTGAGSMRTTIPRSPKNNSSIRRSDLSTAGVDEGVPTIGLIVPGSETDRRLSLSSGTGTHGPESSSADAVSAIAAAPHVTGHGNEWVRAGRSDANEPGMSYSNFSELR
jgi:hypothetical protein